MENISVKFSLEIGKSDILCTMWYYTERVALILLTIFLVILFGVDAVVVKNGFIENRNTTSNAENAERTEAPEESTSNNEEKPTSDSVPEIFETLKTNAPPKTTTPQVVKPKEESIPTKTSTPEKKPEVQASPTLTEAITENVPATLFPLSFSTINIDARKSLVNIICTTQNGGPLMPISGSGVMIDSRGVVLTNAHIAQYLLLKDYLVQNYIECIVRTGAPAYPTYKAELLYISESWVRLNAEQIKSESPMGTGEHDFALLHLTERIDATPIGTVDFLPLAIGDNTTNEGDSVLVAGYPAGFIGGITIQKALYPASSVATIKKIFTFASSTVDLISVGGSIVAQKGSSGGAVVSSEGNLVGLIVTSTQAVSTGERDLRAITLAHINRDLRASTGNTLSGLLAKNLSLEALRFRTTLLPTLLHIYETQLAK